MDWNKGFTARYYISILDPLTWLDRGTAQLTGGSITKNYTSDLVESATIDLRERLTTGAETWIRIWLDARQSGETVHTPVFTGLLSTPKRDLNGNVVSYSGECYSVLKPADDVLLDRGWYAEKGRNAAELVYDLLSVGPAPVEIQNESPTLTEYIVAEDGETNLSMAWKILGTIGWRLRITGNGHIQVLPTATDISATFDYISNDSIELTVTDTQDWFDCPNIFRAVIGNFTATVTDDDPDSFLSTATRGREVWAQETNPSLSDGETIEEYAKRRLTEMQSPSRTLSYDRRFSPDVEIGDLVYLSYPRQGINGTFMVTNQSIDLGYAAKTSEDVVIYEQ